MTPGLRETLDALLRCLAAFGEPYAVVGGIGVILRARARFTRDIDVVLSVPPDRLEALLVAASAEDFAWDDAEVREFAPGGLIRLWGPPDRARGVGVDVLFAEDPFSEAVLQRATAVSVEGSAVRVATIEDLILMKLDANRPRDRDDVLTLKDAAAENLDREYLRRAGTSLELDARIEAFLD